MSCPSSSPMPIYDGSLIVLCKNGRYCYAANQRLESKTKDYPTCTYASSDTAGPAFPDMPVLETGGTPLPVSTGTPLPARAENTILSRTGTTLPTSTGTTLPASTGTTLPPNPRSNPPAPNPASSNGMPGFMTNPFANSSNSSDDSKPFNTDLISSNKPKPPPDNTGLIIGIVIAILIICGLVYYFVFRPKVETKSITGGIRYKLVHIGD